jgi:hypothetical protein
MRLFLSSDARKRKPWHIRYSRDSAGDDGLGYVLMIPMYSFRGKRITLALAHPQLTPVPGLKIMLSNLVGMFVHSDKITLLYDRSNIMRSINRHHMATVQFGIPFLRRKITTARDRS